MFQYSWGLYPWFKESGRELIHPNDICDFEKLQPYGLVFENIAFSDLYLTLRYRNDTFRVKPDLYEIVSIPKFRFGDIVRTKDNYNQKCIIEHILWHYKRGCEMYILSVLGELKSKRYFFDDLESWGDSG